MGRDECRRNWAGGAGSQMVVIVKKPLSRTPSRTATQRTRSAGTEVRSPETEECFPRATLCNASAQANVANAPNTTEPASAQMGGDSVHTAIASQAFICSAVYLLGARTYRAVNSTIFVSELLATATRPGYPGVAPPQSAAIAAFSVTLGRIAAETFAGSGK
jgi:hypothetical protein